MERESKQIYLNDDGLRLKFLLVESGGESINCSYNYYGPCFEKKKQQIQAGLCSNDFYYIQEPFAELESLVHFDFRDRIVLKFAKVAMEISSSARQLVICVDKGSKVLQI